jgi:hypothetical protein
MGEDILFPMCPNRASLRLALLASLTPDERWPEIRARHAALLAGLELP